MHLVPDVAVEVQVFVNYHPQYKSLYGSPNWAISLPNGRLSPNLGLVNNIIICQKEKLVCRCLFVLRNTSLILAKSSSYFKRTNCSSDVPDYHSKIRRLALYRYLQKTVHPHENPNWKHHTSRTSIHCPSHLSNNIYPAQNS